MSIHPSNKSRSRARASRACTTALGAAALCALAALPASAARSAAVSASASEPGQVSVAATLSVENLGGRAAELMHRLTLPQLASLLDVTPEQLVSMLEHAGGSALGALEGLLANPKATVQEVLGLLAENGVSPAAVEQAVAPLVADATQTAEQFRSVIASVLTDLREGGALAALAHELVLPTAVLEGAQLLTGSAQQAAGALGTSASGLSSVLERAGAIAQPLTGATPLVVAPVDHVARGTTLVLGSPTGTGGITLTTVNSPASPGAVAGFKSTSPASVSNAFTILSIKVTRSGAILEKLRLPGPGRLSVSASARKTIARRSVHSRTRTRTVRVAAAALSTSGGTLTLTLRPRGVSRTSRVRVTLATTYSPTGGSPRTLKRFVTLPRRRATRHG